MNIKEFINVANLALSETLRNGNVINAKSDNDGKTYFINYNGNDYKCEDKDVKSTIERIVGNALISAFKYAEGPKTSIEKKEILDEIEGKINKCSYIDFDNAVMMPSVNNAIKEFNAGYPIWEDMSDPRLSLRMASVHDLQRLLREIDKQF